MFYDARFKWSLFVSVLFAFAVLAQETVEFDSTVLKSASYDKDSKALTVTKVNKAVTVYSDVPESVYKGLLEARLKGGYYRGFIESEYDVVSSEEGVDSVHLPSPVSDEAPNPAKIKKDILSELTRADSTLNKIRTLVPDVDTPRKNISQAQPMISNHVDLKTASSLLTEADRTVRDLESRYAKEVNDAKDMKRKLETDLKEDKSFEITQVDQIIEQLDPVVTDLRRASKSLQSASDGLQKLTP